MSPHEISQVRSSSPTWQRSGETSRHPGQVNQGGAWWLVVAALLSSSLPSFLPPRKMLQVARAREWEEGEHPLTLLLCQYPKLGKTYKIRPKDENKRGNPSSFALRLISLSSSEDSSLGIDLLVVRRVWRGERHPLGLVQGIGALVLLPHAVHDEHDEQDGAEEANHSAANKCWGGKGRVSNVFKVQLLLNWNSLCGYISFTIRVTICLFLTIYDRYNWESF